MRPQLLSLSVLVTIVVVLVGGPGRGLSSLSAAEGDPIHISIHVDLGRDIGQNLGTLFEVRDADAEPILGAGFLGAFNTQDRADRQLLHFFLRTSKVEPTIETLPRPTTDCGVYLEGEGNLTARGFIGSKDMARRSWDPVRKEWQRDKGAAQARMRLAGKLLEFRTNEVRHDGRAIFQWTGPGKMEPFYYANGQLIVRHHFPDEEKRKGRLIAHAWTPADKGAVDPAKGQVLELPIPRAFPYACGQLGKELLVTTNVGQVHRLTARGWQTLRETDLKTSYQVYAALNTADRIWLGQYPSGNLFEYRDGKLTHLRDQPPRMPKVSPSARELQTLTIYRGDIYAGVWPWGEVWRYRAGTKRWEFVKRLFTHPPLTDVTVHPYEKETGAVDPNVNLWGQRIASMVPLGDSLYISTSAKGTPPYDPKFTFLADGKWKEYGAVYRYRLPGHLSAPLRWKEGPMGLEFVVEKRQLRILQDGKELATGAVGGEVPRTLAKGRLTLGAGLYGKFAGKVLSQRASGLGMVTADPRALGQAAVRQVGVEGVPVGDTWYRGGPTALVEDAVLNTWLLRRLER